MDDGSEDCSVLIRIQPVIARGLKTFSSSERIESWINGTFAECDGDGGYEEVGAALWVRWHELDELEFFPGGESE